MANAAYMYGIRWMRLQMKLFHTMKGIWLTYMHMYLKPKKWSAAAKKQWEDTGSDEFIDVTEKIKKYY